MSFEKFVITNEYGQFWCKYGEFVEPVLLGEHYIFSEFPKNADLFKGKISCITTQDAKSKLFKSLHHELKEYRKLLKEIKNRSLDELVYGRHGHMTIAEWIPDLEKSIKRMRAFLQQMIAEKY